MPSAFPYRLLLATALLLSFLVDGFHAANNPTAPATPTSTMMASQLRRAASSSAEISLAGEAAVALEEALTVSSREAAVLEQREALNERLAIDASMMDIMCRD